MTAAARTRTRSRYPAPNRMRTMVLEMVEIARSIGIDVNGIEVSPDGSIRVIDSRAPKMPSGPVSDFDRFESEL